MTDPLIALVDAVRAQALDILARRTTTTPGAPTDMVRRQLATPPIEAGFTGHAVLDERTSRTGTTTSTPARVTITPTRAQDDDRECQPQPAAEATADDRPTSDEVPCTCPPGSGILHVEACAHRQAFRQARDQRRLAGHGLDAAVRAAYDDADATLADVDRLTGRDTQPTQGDRTQAAQAAATILRSSGPLGREPLTGHVIDVITLAEWLVDGTLPYVIEGEAGR